MLRLTHFLVDAARAPETTTENVGCKKQFIIHDGASRQHVTTVQKVRSVDFSFKETERHTGSQHNSFAGTL